MSRIGKIARLPKAIREQLNRRMEDGEQQSWLVEWLNGREEVRAMLNAEFDGRPINEPNLTAWAQGGFEDWRRQQEAINAADRVVEETAAVADAIARQATGDGKQETGGRCIADRVADMAALAMAEQLMAIGRMEDGEEKRRAVLKVVRGLVRLRNSERACERGQREAAQAARAAEAHEDWAAGAGRRKTGDRGRVTGDRRTDLNEPEHDYGDVRGRMAEVLAPMSDEEITEILIHGGYMSPAGPPEPNAEDEVDVNEHGVEDVWERMAEVLELMSDEEIAETLSKGGCINPAEPFDKNRFVEAWVPDGSWWSEEDEAAYQAEDEAEKEAEARVQGTIGTTGSPQAGSVVAMAPGAEGPGSSNLPPEGGISNGRQETEDGGQKMEDGQTEP